MVPDLGELTGLPTTWRFCDDHMTLLSSKIPRAIPVRGGRPSMDAVAHVHQDNVSITESRRLRTFRCHDPYRAVAPGNTRFSPLPSGLSERERRGNSGIAIYCLQSTLKHDPQ